MVTQKRKTKLKKYGRYRECPACRTVLYDSGFKLGNLDYPAPCCGAFGDPRILWPPLEVHPFLEMVENQDLSSDEERSIAIVFLCTALELLLENSLWWLLQAHTKSGKLMDFILDSNWGKERRIQLYNKLSDCSLCDLLTSRGMPSFFENWDRLSKLRNNIVHGQYCNDETKEVDLITNVYENCLKAFAELHNAVQRMLHTNTAKV